MLTLSPSEVSTIVEALLNSNTDDVFCEELRLDALQILRYNGPLPGQEDEE